MTSLDSQGEHLILLLLPVVAAFICQADAKIGFYGNVLIDVEENPKILKRF